MTIKARLEKLEAMRPKLSKYSDLTPLQRARRIVALLTRKSVYTTLTEQEQTTLEHYQQKATKETDK